MEERLSTPGEESIPPFIVESDEVRLPTECAFTEACIATMRPICEPGNWRPVDTLLTFTKEWGLVWRTDFIDSRGSLTRAVCWSPPEQRIQIAVAVATDLPPLGG